MLNKIKAYIKKKLGIEKEKVFFTKDHFKNKKFIIGEYTYGQPLVLFENKETNLHIGKYCSIAQGVTIFLGGNHRVDWVTTYPFNALPEHFPNAESIKGHPQTKGNVRIGNDVWLGLRCTILSGVTISDGAVIAAGSIVTKNVGPYEIWGGNPAKFIKKRFSDEQIAELLNISWWNWSEEEIKNNIQKLQANYKSQNFEL